ncbi:MAG: ECF-type sigma factor [Planctomycetota bacterium]
MWPLLYDELRKLAAQQLARESVGQTLQPTALVHEAYVRLIGAEDARCWDNRGHFFGAAAEAMRRILIENARRKMRIKHGGEMVCVDLSDDISRMDEHPEPLIELDTALTKLAGEDPTAAEVVKLHFFAGLPLEEVGTLLGMSRATAYRQWSYARSWLKCELERE